MDKNELKKIWKAEEARSFHGWDFFYLNGRCDSENIPWDYKQMIHSYLSDSDMLLDMGTGGGEFLLTLHHPYEKTAVTEAYPPNISLCEKNLIPLGITVKGINENDALPFADNFFDIIINRHESFLAYEVARVLKPNGIFITQQVGGKNNNDLSKRLLDDFHPAFPTHTLENNLTDLTHAGFEIITSAEAFPPIRFYDIGALVYFAKIIEWEFPQFSVENCFDKLYELQTELEQNGEVCGTEHRFLIVGRKKN